MRTKILALPLLTSVLFSLYASTVSAADAELTKQSVMGFYVNSSSSTSLQTFGTYLKDMGVITYQIEIDGSITGGTPAADVNTAKSKNINTYAVIQNHFEPDLTRKVLSDSALRQKAINNILTLTQNNGYRGVNLDFENMYAADRQLFNSFVKELTQVAKTKSLEVIVSVTAKTNECTTCSWSGAFDFYTLGQTADKIQLMSYDQNGSWGPPGPVAGYPWFEKAIQYAVSQIPSRKVLLGLPAYGYDWNVTTNTGHKAVMWKSIPGLLSTYHAQPVWNETEKSPTLTYTDALGSKHVVWYEDDKSIELKTELANKYSLGGISVWRMGFENESFWRSAYSGLAPKLSGLTTSASSLSVNGLDRVFVSFNLNKPSAASINVLDSSRAPVKSLLMNEVKPAGLHSFEWDGSGLPFGAYTIEVKAVDGNGLSHSASTSIELLDGTAPAISSLDVSPPSLKVDGTNSSILRYSLNEPAAVTLKLINQAGAAQVLVDRELKQSGPNENSFNGLGFALGTYTIELTAADEAGNASKASAAITFRDGYAPVISNVTVSTATLKKTALLNAKSELQYSTNEQAQVEVVLRNQSGNIKPLAPPIVQNAGSYKLTIDSAPLNDGVYDVLIKATDDNANTSSAAARITVVTEKVYGKVTASKLNVRSGPDTAYSIVASYLYGQSVEITGKTDVWYQVKYSSTQTGYVHSSYLTLN
ncbi:glycosyl hydrolase family 18 protein [Paenibacillus chartarius]|uniref:Glycosyl hydrolase family 18 protein n=1 Tax=Paenibacillus chartarius TaxID=747481 RepID=A0ABV6DPQ3_9BACL